VNTLLESRSGSRQPGTPLLPRRQTPQKVSCPVSLLLAAITLSMSATAARAADGCLVLLCFAAPSWRAIPQCVPPVREVLRDLARGRPFPTCAMAGEGNTARHTWATAPGNCPPQYTRVMEWASGSYPVCDFAGAVSVTINGTPFARTWWSMTGDTVTEFSPGAKARLGSWDSRFDDDHALWLATQVATAPVDPTN
jgi:hypothetical protein